MLQLPIQHRPHRALGRDEAGEIAAILYNLACMPIFIVSESWRQRTYVSVYAVRVCYWFCINMQRC